MSTFEQQPQPEPGPTPDLQRGWQADPAALSKTEPLDQRLLQP
jgi:hypothetical protein